MKKNLLIVGILVCALASSAQAQIFDAGHLLGPGAPPPMIGVELGLGNHMQSGTFEASCGCEFASGKGSGFLGGLLFELPIDYEWTIGLGAKLDFKTTTSSTTVLDTATVTFNNTSQVASGSFRFERDGSVKETFLTLAPFLRYELGRNGPFIQAGPGIGFLIGSDFTHKRVITQNSIVLTYIDGSGTFTVDNVRFQNGTKEETLQTGKIVSAGSTRISAIVTAGWNLSLSDNAVIAPMISYDLALSGVRPDAAGPDGSTGWKLSTLYFSVGLKYKLD
ncbi:MAG: outer membrane beta-barrel protein [bacterium]